MYVDEISIACFFEKIQYKKSMEGQMGFVARFWTMLYKYSQFTARNEMFDSSYRERGYYNDTKNRKASSGKIHSLIWP